MNNKAFNVLLHLLAKVMPDVLENKRLAEWLECAANADCLVFDGLGQNSTLEIRQKCPVTYVGEQAGAGPIYSTVEIFIPKFSDVIAGTHATLEFDTEYVQFDVAFATGECSLSIEISSLPWLAIHALQAAAKGIEA
jgi:hypothetical protein